MSEQFVRKVLLATLLTVVGTVNFAWGAQPPITLPDGRVVPGGSCGLGVTTQSERVAILTRWLAGPTFVGIFMLTSAAAVRRRLGRMSDPVRRARSAKVVGVLGATALTLGLYVLLAGGLHLFDIISLYEPMF